MHQTNAGGTKRDGRRWSVAISVPSGAKGYFRIRTRLSAPFAKAVVGNTRETIAWGSQLFCHAFFPPAYPARFKSRAEPRKTVKQWDGVKQRLLI
jgi:hypothetical protein